jgi:hypothetical protein
MLPTVDAMTDEEDATQQAMHDALNGAAYNPARFPEKSYFWLKEYKSQLEHRLALMQDLETGS